MTSSLDVRVHVKRSQFIDLICTEFMLLGFTFISHRKICIPSFGQIYFTWTTNPTNPNKCSLHWFRRQKHNNFPFSLSFINFFRPVFLQWSRSIRCDNNNNTNRSSGWSIYKFPCTLALNRVGNYEPSSGKWNGKCAFVSVACCRRRRRCRHRRRHCCLLHFIAYYTLRYIIFINDGCSLGHGRYSHGDHDDTAATRAHTTRHKSISCVCND